MQTHLFMNSNHAASTPQRRLLEASVVMFYMFALGLITNLEAASYPVTFLPTPAPVKTNVVLRRLTTTNTVEAKVLVVNRDEQTFTVEYDGKMQLFRVEHGAKLLDAKGKRTTLDWIMSGQKVLLQMQQYSTDRANLLAATVLPDKAPAQVAGLRLSKAERKLKSAPRPVEPAGEPVVFPSEDARNHPVLINETDKEYPTPEQPQVENPQPKPEDTAPTQEPKGEPEKKPEPKPDNQ